MEKKTLGFVLTGSFCTFRKAVEEMKKLRDIGYDILPVMSFNAHDTDTRFGKAESFIREIEDITGKSVIHSIVNAEPIGPKELCDLVVVAPCTGNTLSKLALGVTDTPATMAVKSQLRVGRPVLLTVATNDALSGSAQNIGRLMNTKNIFFTPMSQDAPDTKPSSLVADFSLLAESVDKALKKEQLQPVLR